MRIAPAVDESEGAEVRTATRTRAFERCTAHKLAEDAAAPGAVQVHHLLDVLPRAEGAALALRLGGQLGFEALLPLLKLALQRHVLYVVGVAL